MAGEQGGQPMSESRTPEQIAAELKERARDIRIGVHSLDELMDEAAAALLRSSPPPSWREQIRAEIEALKLESYRHVAGNPVADQIAIEWHNAALDKVLALPFSMPVSADLLADAWWKGRQSVQTIGLGVATGPTLQAACRKDLDAVLSRLAAQPETPTRFAWLLERTVDGQPTYWDGGHAESFTRDAYRAAQWPTMADAQRACPPQHYEQWGWRYVEHGFMGPPHPLCPTNTPTAQPAPKDDRRAAVKLRDLARRIGDVQSVAERRSDPDDDHKAMLRTLAEWRRTVFEALDLLDAALASPPPTKENP